MNKVVKITNDNGEVSNYVSFETRLQSFLQIYNPTDGYSVIVESDDFLSHNKGLLDLYKTAITAGQKPTEVGLPGILNMVVFTAKLLKDGNIIQTASACKVLQFYKDFEVGETAARQRLIASLGFSSGDFDIDESMDMDSQNLKHTIDPTYSIQQRVEDEIKMDQGYEKVSDITPQKTVNEVTDTNSQTPTEKKSEPELDQETDTVANDHISVQLMRKIYQKAVIKDVDVPEFKDDSEATTFYKSLLKK